jgi:hypothetical protein
MKHALWFLAFFVLVLAGDRLGGRLLQQQTDASRFRYSRLYGGRAAADVLLAGNSRGLNFYQPYVEQATGLTTFNLSYNGLPADIAKVLVLDYFDRYPAPRILLIDITNCDRPNDELLSGFLPYSAASERLDTLIHSRLPKVWWGGRVSQLTRYNNEIFQRALFYRHSDDEDWLRDHTISPQLAADAGKEPYDLQLQPYLVQQLKETVEAARARGIRVELVIGPYISGFRVNNLDALKAAVEKATALPVHDYRQALNDPACFSDYRHLNKKRAADFIDLMIRDGVLEIGN